MRHVWILLVESYPKHYQIALMSSAGLLHCRVGMQMHDQQHSDDLPCTVAARWMDPHLK